LNFARVGAELAEARLGPDYFIDRGEALLLHGELEESLRAFDVALTDTRERRARATTFGRIAWVHSSLGDAGRAWEALGRAFETLGLRMPVESPTTALETAVRFALQRLPFGRSRGAGDGSRAETELVCNLHYQNVRLGIEYGKPVRVVQSALQALEISAP